MGKALTKDKIVSGNKSLICYNEKNYVKEKFMERQHQQLLDSKSLKRSYSYLQYLESLQGQGSSDWSINDYKQQYEYPDHLKLYVFDVKKAKIGWRFTETDIEVNDLFLASESNLFRNEFNTEIWMFQRHNVDKKGYIRVTNNHLKLIDKLGAKIHSYFVFSNCYIDKKQFLRIICSLTHVKRIGFDNVEFDFEGLKCMNKDARFQISQLIFINCYNLEYEQLENMLKPLSPNKSLCNSLKLISICTSGINRKSIKEKESYQERFQKIDFRNTELSWDFDRFVE